MGAAPALCAEVSLLLMCWSSALPDSPRVASGTEFTSKVWQLTRGRTEARTRRTEANEEENMVFRVERGMEEEEEADGDSDSDSDRQLNKKCQSV